MRNQTMRQTIRNACGAVVLASLLLSGCELGRSHFQMNSNSPTPFFGIDLIPRRSTSSLDPQAKPQPVDSPASPIQAVTDSKPKTRFWNSFASQTARSEATPIPQTTPADDRPINRGPVELLP